MPSPLKMKKRQKPMAVSPARKLIQSKLTMGTMRAQKMSCPPMRSVRPSRRAAVFAPTSRGRCRRPSRRDTQKAAADPQSSPARQ